MKTKEKTFTSKLHLHEFCEKSIILDQFQNQSIYLKLKRHKKNKWEGNFFETLNKQLNGKLVWKKIYENRRNFTND